MIYIFYIFAAILIFLGYKSLRGGIDYLKYFKSELARPDSGFNPFATIFVPCRGLDQDLSENLTALLHQDYPSYEVVFVVDDAGDEAVSVIRDLMREKEKGRRGEGETGRQGDGETGLRIKSKIQNPISKIEIAGAAENEGQKVHNLRRAVLAADAASKVFVFVDSDARPGVFWLRDLVGPLADAGIGCTTGYRWFVAGNGGLAEQFRSVWNASIASALGSDGRRNFCWGGSMAIRRAHFEKMDIRTVWRGTLSDDFAVTRALKNASLPIYFVPGCLTATVDDCTFGEFLEFSTRQMKITRVYAPDLWRASLIGSFLFTIIFFSGIILLFLTEGWHFWLTLVFLCVIFVLGAAKSWVRLEAVRLVLRDYERELRKSLIWHISLWVITPAIYFYNNFCALLSNEITWRGITYKLQSPEETVVLGGDSEKN